MCKPIAGIITLEFCDTPTSLSYTISIPSLMFLFFWGFICFSFLSKRRENVAVLDPKTVDMDSVHCEEPHYGCQDVPNQY